MTKPPDHIFTVDVEDYFQVNAFEGTVLRTNWDAYPPRVERNVDLILALLDRKGAHGTFFTLGWVAKKHPSIVRKIVGGGHEIASHGWWHRKVTTLTPDEFRADVGFVPQVGFREGFGELGYTLRPQGFVRRLRFYEFSSYDADSDNHLLYSEH
ncbi:MAG: polysaccharide deacetylase family protein, partial [Gemmatimonadota bacterium]